MKIKRDFILREIAGDILPELRMAGEYLVSSRPTAVNLSWAVNRMLRCAEENNGNQQRIVKTMPLDIGEGNGVGSPSENITAQPP